MRIEILGTGCPKCRKLMELTEKAVKAAGVSAEISKVDKINDIMITPRSCIKTGMCFFVY